MYILYNIIHVVVCRHCIIQNMLYQHIQLLHKYTMTYFHYISQLVHPNMYIYTHILGCGFYIHRFPTISPCPHSIVTTFPYYGPFQWPFQIPIYWRYLPYARPRYGPPKYGHCTVHLFQALEIPSWNATIPILESTLYPPIILIIVASY